MFIIIIMVIKMMMMIMLLSIWTKVTTFNNNIKKFQKKEVNLFASLDFFSLTKTKINCHYVFLFFFFIIIWMILIFVCCCWSKKKSIFFFWFGLFVNYKINNFFFFKYLFYTRSNHGMFVFRLNSPSSER